MGVAWVVWYAPIIRGLEWRWLSIVYIVWVRVCLFMLLKLRDWIDWIDIFDFILVFVISYFLEFSLPLGLP